MILVKRDDSGDSGALVVSSIILTIIGLLFVIRGYKIYRIAIMLISGIFLAHFCVSVANSSSPTITDQTLLIIGIVSGIIGAIIGYTFYKFCLYIVGALAGVYVGSIILSLKQPSLIESQGGRIAFLIIFGLIGSILVHKVERIAIMGATSIIGSDMIMVAIDLFAKTGFANTLNLWESGNFDSHIQNKNVWVLVVGFVLVSIFGFVVQRKNIKK